jgi:DNA-binding IclR family transcriptional regulator
MLTFLAQHEDQSFSLSELCRRLDLSKSTGHSILTTLLDAGFVLRDSDRTYLLGPAVIPLGEAAAGHHRAVAVARRELEPLARELDAQCTLSMVVNDSIMVLGHAGRHAPAVAYLQVLPPTQRWPFAPPLGAVFVAWWETPRIDQWLDDTGKGLSDEQRRRFVSALDEVRRRGYSVSAMDTSRDELTELMRSVTDLPHEPDVAKLMQAFLDRVRYSEGYNVGQLEPGVVYDVTALVAPIFDRSGEVTLVLTLQSLAGPMLAREIERAGRRLLQRAEAVTRAVGGRSRLRR